MSQMGFVQTEPRAEFGLSRLFRLRNLDSKSLLIFWLAGWVLQHSNSGKPRQMVTWITARQVWLSWYFPCDKVEGRGAIWWNMAEGPSAAGRNANTFQGKRQSATPAPAMRRMDEEGLAFWDSQWCWAISSILMGGWESKAGQVGQVPQCKSTAGCRETGKGKVDVWWWRKKEERGFTWRRREASSFCGAECLQKGQREQESGAANREQVCYLFPKVAGPHSYFLQAILE